MDDAAIGLTATATDIGFFLNDTGAQPVARYFPGNIQADHTAANDAHVMGNWQFAVHGDKIPPSSRLNEMAFVTTLRPCSPWFKPTSIFRSPSVSSILAVRRHQRELTLRDTCPSSVGDSKDSSEYFFNKAPCSS